MYTILTSSGRKIVREYIADLKAKREKILTAGNDSANKVFVLTLKDIEATILFYFDQDRETHYCHSWGATDHYDSDLPLILKDYKDFEVRICY